MTRRAGRSRSAGVDLRAMTLEDVRSSVTVVTQRPLLFTEHASGEPGRRDV